jgi:hypothetical protein
MGVSFTQGAAAVPGSGTPALPRETNPQTSLQPAASKNLSSGARAAIGVVMTFVVIAIVSVILFVRLRKRRKDFPPTGGDLPELVTQEGSRKRLLGGMGGMGGMWREKDKTVPIKEDNQGALTSARGPHVLPTSPVELEAEREPLEIGATTPITAEVPVRGGEAEVVK